MEVRHLFALAAVLVAPVVGHDGASAHGGGLDSSGGHHCRQAGYDSGKCSPLNSYHCHQSPCGDAAPATTATTARATTTTVRRTTTTTPPATTTTTVAPTTTTAAPTLTTTSTTVATTTSTEATTTTIAVANLSSDPASTDRSEEEAGPGAIAVTLALLGGLGFAGYRFVSKKVRRPIDGDAV